MIKILGIDPGTNITGYGVIQLDGNKIKYLYHAILKTGLKNKYTEKLARINIETERVIKEFKPQTIFTHHLGDLNKDHVITHRASLIASRPMEGNFITNEVITSQCMWSDSKCRVK